MRAGRLDREISVMRKQIALSPSGDVIETWIPVILKRAASLSPIAGSERWAAEQYVAQEQVEFQVRWARVLATLSPQDRIICPALSLADLEGSPPAYALEATIGDRRQYEIMAVLEIGRREALRILAARRVDTISLDDAETIEVT